MKRTIIVIVIAVTGLIFAKQHGQRGAWQNENLDESQKEQLHQLVSQMKENGAERTEIRGAVSELFENWGIEHPGNQKGHKKRKKDCEPKLSDDQRSSVNELRKSMRSSGASREEIRDSVQSQLKNWGIERDGECGPGKGHGFGHRHRPQFMDELTEEQRTQLHELKDEMKSVGADRDEIHIAMQNLLEGWGIEIPDHPGRRGRHGHHRELWDQLTEPQRDELHNLRRQMRDSGASREEIQEAVKLQLDEWGVEGSVEDEDIIEETASGNLSHSSGNHPNPFNPETTITYSIQSAGIVSIDIYDLSGRLVKSFGSNYRAQGEHSQLWDGSNQYGEAAPSGVYLYQIKMGDMVISDSMLMIK